MDQQGRLQLKGDNLEILWQISKLKGWKMPTKRFCCFHCFAELLNRFLTGQAAGGHKILANEPDR
jgi:hypothetical protein